ncbi:MULTISPECIES: hypothetical protein [unclassified Streptomyces]|uniref:hypothetical protein n=1 Tax=unclassified Streptomyces TaxID=2593676 RepID=UPI0033CD88A0
MSKTAAPQGLALVCLVAGALIMTGAALGHLITGVPLWRYVLAGGGALYFAGWVLGLRRARRLKGGAR